MSAAALAAAAGASWIAITAERGLPGQSHYRLQAEFADLANLRENDDVRIAGRRVGQVLDPRFERGRSVAELQLEPGVGPLPADTAAIVRAKGVLGARFLELVPGKSRRSLARGDTISSSRTSVTLQLPDVLAAFDRATRARLQDFVNGAGLGLAGRGRQMNRMLEETPQLLRDARELSRAVLERDGAAARFAPSLSAAADAFDGPRLPLARGFERQAQGLRPFAESRPAVEALLETAPAALSGTRGGLAASQPLLDEATALARAAGHAFDRAPAALAETRALLVESHRPLRRSVPLFDRLRQAAPPTVALVKRAAPVLDPLRRGLAVSTPTLDELTAHRCDVEAFAANWRSMLEWGVPGGGEIGALNVFRFALIGTPESLGRAGRELPGGPIGTNAYPEPCEAGTEELP